MCGLVAFVSAYSNGFSTEEADTFRDMLVIDTLRGFDSTGVCGIENNGNITTVKDAINGASFVQTKEFSSFKTDMIYKGIFMFGHNRAATRGSITDRNAHPFCVNDNIILAQNGTYNGDHKHLKDTDVDSEALAHVLEEYPNIEDALQRVNAAYSLIWYNVKESTLYFINNGKRPMHVTYTKDGGALFASESETILAAASRNMLTLDKAPYPIAESALVSFKLDKATRSWSSDCKKNMNIDFDYKHSPFRNYTHSPEMGNIGGTWRGWPNYRTPETPVTHTAPKAYQEHPNSMLKNIHDFVGTGALDEYHLSPHECTVIQDSMRMTPRSKPTFIEALDYFPCNHHADCTSWIVYGVSVNASLGSKSAVYYKVFFDKTEKEIIDITAHTWFEVNGNNPVTHMYRDEKTSDNHRVVTVFCPEMEPIDMEKTGTQ
jgi:hypothetical protein